jgi:hypothetical protein
MNPQTKSPRNPWPYAIIAFFVLFISFTVALVGYIGHQKMDLVRGDYYDDEIRYQEQLDRMNRTGELKTKVTIAYDRVHETITISLPPSSGAHTTNGRIRLYRPSDESLDQDIKLAPDPAGHQNLTARNLLPGLWKVRVYWTVDGQDYYSAQSLIISSKAS